MKVTYLPTLAPWIQGHELRAAYHPAAVADRTLPTRRSDRSGRIIAPHLAASGTPGPLDAPAFPQCARSCRNRRCRSGDIAEPDHGLTATVLLLDTRILRSGRQAHAATPARPGPPLRQSHPLCRTAVHQRGRRLPP